MLNERYQVHAKTISKGEHDGYITCSPDGTLCLEWRVWDGKAPRTEKNYVLPETIEPVRVKPIRIKWEFAQKEGRYRHFCPNCEPDCVVVKDENKLEYCLTCFGQPDYCPWCGIALDWSD